MKATIWAAVAIRPIANSHGSSTPVSAAGAAGINASSSSAG